MQNVTMQKRWLPKGGGARFPRPDIPFDAGHGEVRPRTDAADGVIHGFGGPDDPDFVVTDLYATDDTADVVLAQRGLTLAQVLVHQIGESVDGFAVTRRSEVAS